MTTERDEARAREQLRQAERFSDATIDEMIAIHDAEIQLHSELRAACAYVKHERERLRALEVERAERQLWSLFQVGSRAMHCGQPGRVVDKYFEMRTFRSDANGSQRIVHVRELKEEQ